MRTGGRIRAVTLIVEVQEDDGSIETHTVAGIPAKGKRIEIHPHYASGLIDRVAVLLDSTIVALDGYTLHRITRDQEHPDPALSILTIREITS